MKITTMVKINSHEVSVISKALRLDFFTPGRGILRVETKEEIKRGQLVEVAMKIGGQDAHYVFIGFVESITPEKGGVSQLLIRELSALLNRKVKINLQHCTIEKALEELSKQTGAHFVYPESDWAKDDLPRFQHIGNGYSALDKILTAFNVENGCWHQQTDGIIYVGKIEKSAVRKKILNIEPAIFESISIVGGQLPAMPRLRPGVKIKLNDQEKWVSSIEINENTMRLNWSENIFNKRMVATQ